LGKLLLFLGIAKVRIFFEKQTILKKFFNLFDTKF